MARASFVKSSSPRLSPGPAFKTKPPEWVKGYLFADQKLIPRVATRLTARDIFGALKVRCDIGRANYRVPSGVYAVGDPSPESIVLVTANYKLSFDSLRKELSGLDAWMLVLDTKGVNVWCAAGKGTFGTGELLRQIDRNRLASLVSHRTLILPQLGAPGVSAREVEAASGFRVVYGPVRAADTPQFLQNGMKKDDRMSRVEFRLRDRLAVAPAELVHAWPCFLVVLAIAAGARLFAGWNIGRVLLLAFALGSPVCVGTILFPALIPVLPFKSFALKGSVLGIVWNAALAYALHLDPAWAFCLVLTMTPVTAFLSLNFTGSSTYTNLTGTRREVAIGVPIMIASEFLGLVLAIGCSVFYH